jgi:putative nucleotidyltransferase with HDIG domain
MDDSEKTNEQLMSELQALHKRVAELEAAASGQVEMIPAEVLITATRNQIIALAATVDAKDPYTLTHSKGVAEIAETIGEAAGLSKKELSDIRSAALLHDIGKVGVPDAILTKPDNLSGDEMEIIRKHAAEGARIVGFVEELTPLVPLIRHHHERYDGTGYPDGLKGEAIPLGARILHIADAYDTMTTPRGYREVLSQKDALEELMWCSEKQFDPKLVEAFCRAIGVDSDEDDD